MSYTKEELLNLEMEGNMTERTFKRGDRVMYGGETFTVIGRCFKSPERTWIEHKAGYASHALASDLRPAPRTDEDIAQEHAEAFAAYYDGGSGDKWPLRRADNCSLTDEVPESVAELAKAMLAAIHEAKGEGQ